MFKKIKNIKKTKMSQKLFWVFFLTLFSFFNIFLYFLFKIRKALKTPKSYPSVGPLILLPLGRVPRRANRGWGGFLVRRRQMIRREVSKVHWPPPNILPINLLCDPIPMQTWEQYPWWCLNSCQATIIDQKLWTLMPRPASPRGLI